MADYKLGVDSNQTYKLYTTDDGTTTEVATITGLKENLITSGETQPVTLPTGITVDANTKKITIGNTALPESPTAGSNTIEVTGTAGYTIALASDVNTKPSGNVSNTAVTYKNETDTGLAIVKGTVDSAGWWQDDLESTTKIFYSTTPILATVSGLSKSLSQGVTVGAENKIVLGSAALGTDSAKLTNKISGITYGLSLANEDGLYDSETEAFAGYSLAVSGGKAEAYPEYKAYWTLGNNSTILSHHDATVKSSVATLQGLSSSATKDNVKLGNKTKVFTLYEAALTTDPNKTVSITGSGEDYKNFKLKLADDVDRVGSAGTTDYNWSLSWVDENNDSVKGAEDSQTATLLKNVAAGWSIAGDSTTISYTGLSTLTYAEITGLRYDVTADKINAADGFKISDKSKAEEVFELNKTFLSDNASTSKAVVLTNETPTGGTASTFKLAIGAGVNTYSASAITGSFSTAVKDVTNGSKTTATASVYQMMAEYWSLGNDAKKITYNASAASSTAFVSVEGLRAGASKADVEFNLSSQIKGSIGLKASALSFAAGQSVELKTDVAESEYKLYLNGVAEPKATKTNPSLSFLATANGSLSIITIESEGWETLEANKKFAYVGPSVVTLAKIEGLQSSLTAAANAIKLDGTTGTINVTLSKAALQDVTTNIAKITEVTTAADNPYANDYDFKFALGSDVSLYGSAAKVPKLTVETVDGGTKTAKIQVTESQGWSLSGMSYVKYAAASAVDLAQITSLASGAASGTNVFFNGATSSILIAAGALQSTANAVARFENLRPTGYESYVYTLGASANVVAPGASYAGAAVTVGTNGTASVTGTLAAGWSFASATATYGTSWATYTYKAALADSVLAKITGLSTGANGSGLVSLGSGSTVLLKVGALADNHVRLENTAPSAGTFSLSLANESASAVSQLGYSSIFGWNVAGADNSIKTAYYNEGWRKGWDIGNSGLSVLFTPEVKPQDASAKHIFTLTNLSKDLVINNSTSYVNNEIGTGTGADFVAGISILADAGKLVLKKNALSQNSVAFTKNAATKDASYANYSLSLFTGEGASYFVPQAAEDKNIWTVSGTTAEYKAAKAEYWSVAGNGITYTKQTTGTRLAQITGLKAGLSVGNDDTQLMTANGGSAVAYVLADYKAAVGTSAAVIGDIQLNKYALGTNDVKLTNGSNVTYKLSLFNETGSASSVAAPSIADAAWTVASGNASLKGNITKEGYALSTDAKTVAYVGTKSSETLATLTGIKSTLSTLPSTNVNTTSSIITIDSTMLGDNTIKLTSPTAIKYSLSLAVGANSVPISTVANEKVWRVVSTTAYYRNVKPGYYTLNDTKTEAAYTNESTSATYAKITGLKSGLSVGTVTLGSESVYSALGTWESSTFKPGLFVTKAYTASTASTDAVIGEINVSANVLNQTATLTDGKDVNDKAVDYELVLNRTTNYGGSVAWVSLSGAPTWTVSNGTATLKGKMTKGWLVDDTGNKAVYSAAATTAKTLATVKGLNKTLTATNIGTGFTVTGSGSDVFALGASHFNGTDVTLKNGEYTDGRELGYSLSLAEAVQTLSTSAIKGEMRWELSGTKLAYTNIHDAHYEMGTTSVAGVAVIDPTTIKYIAEKKDESDVTLTDLKSGLSLSTADNGYKVDGKYYIGKNPVSGIKVSGQTITVSLSALNTDATKPLTLTNREDLSTPYTLDKDDGSAPDPTPNTKIFEFKDNKATLHNGTTEGYRLSGNTITYYEPAYTSDLAVVTGLKGGFSVGTKDDKSAIGYSLSNGSFSTVLTYDSTKLMLTDAVLDPANSKTVSITSTGGYTLDISGVTAKPTESNGAWFVNDNNTSTTTATYKKGTTAGWALDDSGNAVYQPWQDAAASATLATVSNLAGKLEVSDDRLRTAIVTSKGASAVWFTQSGASNIIMVANGALNGKNVTLKNGAASSYIFGLYQGMSSGGKMDGYVDETTYTGIWTRDTAKAAATYTLANTTGYETDNTAEVVAEGKTSSYDARIIYSKSGSTKFTLTGLNDNISIGSGSKTIGIRGTMGLSIGEYVTSGGTSVWQDNIKGKTVLVTQSVLGNTNTKLSGSGYTLVLSDPTKANDPRWNIKNGTATYSQTFAAGNRKQKSPTEIAYSGTSTVENIFTITGINAGLSVVNGTSAAVAAKGLTFDFAPIAASGASVNLIKIAGTSVLASTNVKLTNGFKDDVKQDYYLWLGNDTANLASASFAVKSLSDTAHGAPGVQWSYTKGTATLDEGKTEGWAYKVNNAGKATEFTDYTQLIYTKPTKTVTATVKGLNTNLVADNGEIYVAGTDGKKKASTGPVISVDKATYAINLSASAMIGSDSVGDLKKGLKVTLTVAKGSSYALVNNGSISTPVDAANEWSFDSKGTASYQYDTSDGWTFSDDGKTVAYSLSTTTTLAKIAGFNKAYSLSGTSASLPFIEITTEDNITSTGAVEGTKTVFTLNSKTATSGGSTIDILPQGKITLTPVDKKNAYALAISEDLAPADYDEPFWKFSSGTATYNIGTSDGYSVTSDKVVTYVKESLDKTPVITITGFNKTKGTEEAVEALVNKIEVDRTNHILTLPEVQTLSSGALSTPILFDNKTSVVIKSDDDYAFAEGVGYITPEQNSANPDPFWTVKSGTATLQKKMGQGYTWSDEGKKLTYTKATDATLATVKGLNKELVAFNSLPANSSLVSLSGKVLFHSGSGSALGDYTEVLSVSDQTLMLKANALTTSKVTLTNGKGYSYELGVDSDVITAGDTTEWQDQTGWTFKNGTATYKNYNKAYYTLKSSTLLDYAKETSGTVYAQISGLKSTADISSFDNSSDPDSLSGTITITKDMLVAENSKGKAVKLTNKKDKAGTTGNFALALNTSGLSSAYVSTLSDFKLDNKGKLTATQSAGYTQASDTQINFVNKAKTGQLVATISGIPSAAAVSGVKTTSGGSDVAITTLNNETVNNDLVFTVDTSKLTNKKTISITTTALTSGNYTLALGGSSAPAISTDVDTEWTPKGKTATLKGIVTPGYVQSASGKSIGYFKAVGKEAVLNTDGSTKTAAKPANILTVKVKDGEASDPNKLSNISDTLTISDNNVTVSSGLFAVNFTGNTAITGSKDNDSITATSSGISVTGGKGDDAITLGSGANTVIYSNGDGFDVITGFDSDDTLFLNSGKVTSVKQSGSNAVVTVGKQFITLQNVPDIANINIVDKKGNQLNPSYASSSDVLLADDNYSMDAASLSDITEPFKASYTPYDFDAGLDLVKQNSIAPALTFTGTSDKK